MPRARVEPPEEVRTRRAMLHLLEDLQRDRDTLRQTRRRWLDTVDAVTDPLMVHDAAGRVVRCNRAYAALAGVDVRDVIGQVYWQVFPKKSSPLPGCCQVMEGKRRTVEEEFTLPGGQTFVSRSFSFAIGPGQAAEFLHIMQDITERKRAHEVLEASEHRFRALTENAADLICLADASGRISYASPALTPMGGYLVDEVLGQPFLNFIHPEDAAQAQADLAVALRNPLRPMRRELRFRHKNGAYVVLELVARNALNDPAVKSIVVNARDVTERKRAEAAIRESEATYRALFDNMLNGIAHCRMLFENGQPVDFVYLHVNAAFTAQTGLKDVVGRRVTELIPGIREADPALLEQYGRVVKSGAPERFEIFIESLQQWHRVSLFRLFRDEFVSVFDVVTAEKRKEQALKLFRELVDQSGDAIEVVDPQTLRFLDVNETACRELGYTRDQLLAMSVADIDPQLNAARLAAREQKLQDAGAVSLETVHRRSDGSTFPVEVRVKRVQLDRTYQVATARDITERKQAEESLRRTHRALKTLSAGNSAVVHASSEEQLLQMMCQVIVEWGGYLLAWVGYAEQDAARSVRPVAWADGESEYVQQANASWADTERGRGPVGRCIRTGEAQVTREISSDPTMTPWHEQARKYGYQSSLALPLAGPAGVFGVLSIYAAEVDAFDVPELALLSEMAGDLAYGILALRTSGERLVAEEKLRLSLEGTIAAVGATMEARDPYTAGHQRRVASLGAAIATEMGLPENVVAGIRFGGLIHDIGKIQVPAEILSKPTHLSKLEHELIKVHPQAGYDIVKGIEFPWPIALMVLEHHERLDGSGYPQGLKGDQIALEARILAVADVVEAMSSHRPYRAGLGLETALKEIEAKKGTWFEAKAVDACLLLFRGKGFNW